MWLSLHTPTAYRTVTCRNWFRFRYGICHDIVVYLLFQIEQEAKIYPGEVVKIEKVVTKKWKLVDGTLRGLIKPETQFLKCRDLKKKELCVSMAHPGMFNPVAQNGLAKDEKVVYLINDIPKVFKLPVHVKLAFGWPPKLSGSHEFSGVLKLQEVLKKETLVSYNFHPNKSMIAELPTDLNIKLQTIENMEEIEECETFKRAMEQCLSLVYPYVVSMKTMNIPYESTEEAPPPKKTPMSFGKMSRPYDMRLFSRSDIFPPLEEQQMSTLSRIAFKDPERALAGLYKMDMQFIIHESNTESTLGLDRNSRDQNHSDSSSQIDDASDKLSQTSLGSLEYGRKELSAVEYSAGPGVETANIPANIPSTHTLESEMRDSRAKRIREIQKREAAC